MNINFIGFVFSIYSPYLMLYSRKLKCFSWILRLASNDQSKLTVQTIYTQ